jgi:CDGSH-type Zn-finger protein
MKPGIIVMVMSDDHNDKKAAEVLSVDNDLCTVKMCDTQEVISINQSNLKRKKLCVCNTSKNKPFCDGSHSLMF